LCEICHQASDEESMLLCDECDRGFHLYCLEPPLKSIPKSDWYCMDCLRSSGGDYGFEDGKERSLPNFQKIANGFKQKWFHELADEKGHVHVAEDQIEKEFWRLIESPYDDVSVEYGADLHSSRHGSGFPTPERQPLDPYANCGWNLNNVSILPKSLLTYVRNDVSGMMQPWLYVGMVFSTFCWHTEDHFTYSINYNHWGDTKTWYGIPSSDADKFEALMRTSTPELFEENPDLLFHLTTLMSPAHLQRHKVKTVYCHQRAGEFVMTFPRAYHAGFNQGFNFAEAVNLALHDWLPYGRQCVQQYATFSKQPVFSHAELLL
ncbi:hypothetical protein CXG81DRAFT_787, partial [Caulochytrium protostelioides]